MTSLLRDVEATPLDESLRRLRTLVSAEVGVIRAVEPSLAGTDDAPLVTASCALPDTRDLVGCEIDACANAWSTTGELALAAALGEAAERYSAGFVPDGETVLASADELGPEACDPTSFALFSAAQHADPAFPVRPFTRPTRVRWVRGFALPDGAPAWLPAQLVYLAGERAPGEEVVGYATSNGLACRPTLEEAVLSALLELLERDAFLLTWYGRLSLPRLRAEGVETLERFRNRYLEPTGLRTTVVDLSPFHGVPTCLALVHGKRRDAVALAVGAAAAPRIEEAWTRALAEAFATRAWARMLRRQSPARGFEPEFEDVVDFDDHVQLHALRRHARHASFLAASRRTRHVRDVPALEGDSVSTRIAALLARLDRIGARAYAVDVTARDIRAAGLRVVRVLVPRLCPLDVIHRARFLGGPRLYRAAFELGLVPAPLTPDELNPFPHPFP